jgi:hypothetical protein
MEMGRKAVGANRLLKNSRNVIARKPLAILSLSKDGDLGPI